MNSEQKQSINLSAYAEAVLREDRELFAPALTFTGFLNAVITKYCPAASASIHRRLEKSRSQLAEAMEDADPLFHSLTPSQRKAVTHLLDGVQRESLLEKSRSYDSGRTFTFRLNNENCLLLSRDSAMVRQETVYYGGYLSRYLKAVVEEYCSLSRYQREAVFFQDYIDLAGDAARNGHLLRVEMSSPLTGKETWDVRPYAILPDASRLYHYLVGRSVHAGGLKRDEKVVSIRLSRIRRLTVQNRRTARSGALTAAEKKEIRRKISVNSVAFLIGEEEEVLVRLTDNGRRLYDNTLFLRPALHHIDEEGRCHFCCTKMQAMNYFIRFGADAEILSPPSLRDAFAETYRKAADLYV